MKIFIQYWFGLCVFVYSSVVIAQQPELMIPQNLLDIRSMDFNNDGSLLIVTGGNKSIIWNVSSGKATKVLLGHKNIITASVFSPNSELVATGSIDGDVILWNVLTGKEINRLKKNNLKNEDERIFEMLFSSDNKILISRTPSYVNLWSVSTGKLLKKISSSENYYNCIALHPNGSLYIGLSQGMLEIWNLSSLTKIKNVNITALLGSREDFHKIIIDPDGRNLYTLGWYVFLRAWDISTMKPLHLFEGHKGSFKDGKQHIVSMSVSSNKLLFSCGQSDSIINAWDLTGHSLQWSYKTNSSNIVLTYNNNSGVLAIGSRGGRISFLDTRSKKIIKEIESNQQSVYYVQWKKDGASFISTRGLTITSWEPKSVKDYPAGMNEKEFSSPLVSPDGSLLAVRHSSRDLSIWDLEKNLKQCTINSTSSEKFIPLAFSNDNTLIAAKLFNSLKLCDANNGSVIKSFEMETKEGGFSCAAISADKRLLLTGGTDALVRLWDFETGKIQNILKGHSLWIYCVAISSNNTWLASGGQDGTVKLWNTSNGKLQWSSKSHDEWLNSVAFSSDNKFLISAANDKTAKVWDVVSGKNILTLRGHTEYVYDARFSSDGEKIITGSMDGSIKIWNAKTGALLVTCYYQEENNWVIVTPDGRFDGTPEGMKQMHYVQGLNILPLESFFDQFYTPNLLAQVLSGGVQSVKTSSVDFSKSIKLPPLVKIISPKLGESFTTDGIEILLEAVNQGGGIDEIRLFQNGKLVSEEQRGMKKVETTGEKITKKYQVTLLSGANTFRATAYNNDRTESIPDEITIELKSAQAGSNLYLFAVGINEYKNGKYNLNYGKSDATAFMQTAMKGARTIFQNVIAYELYDGLATRPAIEDVFNKITAEAKPQDAFVFYYAGHGVMSEGSPNVPSEFFLIPTDVIKMYGDDEMLIAKAISAVQLKIFCTKIKAQKQLVILDACQSGGAIESFALRGAAEEKAILQLARSAGTVVLAATGTEQFATEFSALGHGVFTFALLEGLNGNADGSSNDGKITVKELEAYLNDKVPELTKKYRGTAQYPNSYARGQDFPIGVK